MEKEYKVIYQFVSENYNSTFQFLEKLNRFIFDYFDIVFSHQLIYKPDFFVKLGQDELILVEIVPPFNDLEIFELNFNNFESSSQMMVDVEQKLIKSSKDGNLTGLTPVVVRLVHSFIC